MSARKPYEAPQVRDLACCSFCGRAAEAGSSEMQLYRRSISGSVTGGELWTLVFQVVVCLECQRFLELRSLVDLEKLKAGLGKPGSPD